MRSIYYIATVLSSYRKIIDDVINNRINDKTINYYLKVLNRCANRESNPQFFKGLPNYKDQYYNGNREVSNQDFLGVVLSNDNGLITLEQRNYFSKGDVINIFGPKKEPFNIVVSYIKNSDNELVDAARHPKEILRIPCYKKVSKIDLLRVNFLG